MTDLPFLKFIFIKYTTARKGFTETKLLFKLPSIYYFFLTEYEILGERIGNI